MIEETINTQILNEQQLAYSEFKEVIERELKKILPNFGSNTAMQMGEYFSMIPFRNPLSFKDSPYDNHYKSELIHFTSLKSLFSILNEGAIRLYSISNSDDEKELSVHTKLLGINDSYIRRHKQMLFTFSCCDLSEINNTLMWEKYGNNGEGVLMEFKIENHDNWKNFQLAKIDYEAKNYFSDLIASVRILERKHGVVINVGIEDLLAFHKTSDLDYEKEFRLLFNSWGFNNHENSNNPEIFIDVNKRHETVRYYKLLLFRDKNDFDSNKVLFQKPVIVLKKIILGKKLISHFTGLRDAINNRAIINLGYKPKIEI